MTRRSSTIGLSLLCALASCAFVVQSASAAKAVNTTAFTCVKNGGNLDFKDPHCNEQVTAGTGEYGHELIKVGETTEIEASNTSKVEFSGGAFGASIIGTCNKARTLGELHNIDQSGKHTVTGESFTEITDCSVQKPAKCDVQEPLVVGTEFEGVEGLGPEKDQMGGEVRPIGGGETFVTIKFVNLGAEKCALNGKSSGVGGSTVGTGAIPPTEKFSGEANFTIQ